MQRGLEEGHVQRVTVGRVAGGREIALLQVRVPGETVHVVLLQGAGGATRAGTGAGAMIAVVDKEARARLREGMEGASAPGTARARAIAEQVRAGLAGVARKELEERGARLVDELVQAGAGARAEALRKALGKARARVERRIEAVRGDVARAESADAMAQRAQLFVAEAARAPRGATKLVAVDWSSGEARDVELAIDPARGAQQQVEAMFQRARRLKEGARIARARLADAEKTREELAAVERTLAARETAAGGALGQAEAAGHAIADEELDALEGRARAAAPKDFKLLSARAAGTGPMRAKRGAQAPRPPYRTFVGASGARILVGRGAEKNDELTLHVARPHDLWLHAKNRVGAHVVVPLDKNASCPADLLVEAAHLAAHFSDARDERVVEVQYTPRRYLRKPRGSAPGFVVVEREKVLVLRREDDVLRRLLDREEEA
jgi:predicted ribosome quality control (RQC) complex YloA/Tae2 family protein